MLRVVLAVVALAVVARAADPGTVTIQGVDGVDCSSVDGLVRSFSVGLGVCHAGTIETVKDDMDECMLELSWFQFAYDDEGNCLFTVYPDQFCQGEGIQHPWAFSQACTVSGSVAFTCGEQPAAETASQTSVVLVSTVAGVIGLTVGVAVAAGMCLLRAGSTGK